MRQMKYLLAFLILFNLSSSQAQDIKFGIEVSPAFNLHAHHSKTTTAWSSENGYGFNAGFAMRYPINEYTALNTGLNYEYVSFDNWAYNTLQSSLRFGSIHLPLMFSREVIGSWHANFGGGINYLFMNNRIVPGTKVSISNSIDKFQPYVGLGVSTLMDRNAGLFELGFNARYHFMELWNENDPIVSASGNHIVALDLVMRFYF